MNNRNISWKAKSSDRSWSSFLFVILNVLFFNNAAIDLYIEDKFKSDKAGEKLRKS